MTEDLEETLTMIPHCAPFLWVDRIVNTDDIWEVRVDSGSDTFRLFGFFDGPALIVLNHAIKKKTQKTPLQAIKTAADRKRDYFARRVGK